MSIITTEIAAQVSLTAALRQVMNQVLRLLEGNDSHSIQTDGGPLLTALDNWRKTIVTQTSELSVKRARQLENEALELRGKLATLEKECAELRERNGSLREELVRINQREERLKQEMLEAKLSTKRHKTEARELDMEVRDLRRRLRELEGGPPLSPAEAAPRSVVEVEETSSPEPQSSEIEVQVPLSSARSAVEDAFRAMWTPPAAVKVATDDQPAPPAKVKTAKATAKKPAKKKEKKTTAKKTKKATVKKTKKATVKKTKKAPAKKTPAKKTPAKKTTAKKTKTKRAAAKQGKKKKAKAKKAAKKVGKAKVDTAGKKVKARKA
jgi:hypothetical protein